MARLGICSAYVDARYGSVLPTFCLRREIYNWKELGLNPGSLAAN